LNNELSVRYNKILIKFDKSSEHIP
jgi:hypothetical protein